MLGKRECFIIKQVLTHGNRKDLTFMVKMRMTRAARQCHCQEMEVVWLSELIAMTIQVLKQVMCECMSMAQEARSGINLVVILTVRAA